ncbi:ABC transporter permease [Gordonia soli]|uniref:Putative peptide ABC transporter permease protein n=1 Tax=Gordonia soli NBRC 108243 TaxID=1223545 RepID=M0QP69_9ACTN|nr:ABC transporter permease [Gordonia soli]GAC70445.1 putative peptide ABC transporter permease protein [Gordonia soli NBRC 108243]
MTPAVGISARIRRPGQLAVGGAVVLVVVALGLLAPLLASHDPLEQISGANLLPPGADHLLGTDELNRDVFSRVLYGVRTTLLVLVTAVPIGAAVGIAIGLLAAVSGIADTVSARVFDVVLAFPAVILAITVAAIRGPGTATVIIAIAITEIPIFGRLARNEATRVIAAPYVESARLSGASTWWTLRTHVLPNAIEPLVVQFALSLSLAVFVESAMSFIGVGVRPPDPSLGSILADGVYAWDVNPGHPLGPLVMIALLSLGFLLIAQGLGRRRRD